MSKNAHKAKKNTENVQICAEAEDKESEEEGQFSQRFQELTPEDEALQILRANMNNPNFTANQRSDAAAKLLTAMKANPSKERQAIHTLSRHDLVAQITHVQAQLAAKGL